AVDVGYAFRELTSPSVAEIVAPLGPARRAPRHRPLHRARRAHATPDHRGSGRRAPHRHPPGPSPPPTPPPPPPPCPPPHPLSPRLRVRALATPTRLGRGGRRRGRPAPRPGGPRRSRPRRRRADRHGGARDRAAFSELPGLSCNGQRGLDGRRRSRVRRERPG